MQTRAGAVRGVQVSFAHDDSEGLVFLVCSMLSDSYTLPLPFLQVPCSVGVFLPTEPAVALAMGFYFLDKLSPRPGGLHILRPPLPNADEGITF